MTFPYLSEAVARSPFVFVCATGALSDPVQTCWLMDSNTLYASFPYWCCLNCPTESTHCAKRSTDIEGEMLKVQKGMPGTNMGSREPGCHVSECIIRLSPGRREDTRGRQDSCLTCVASTSSGGIFMLIELKEQPCVPWICDCVCPRVRKKPFWNMPTQAQYSIRSTQADNHSGTLKDILPSTSRLQWQTVQ